MTYEQVNKYLEYVDGKLFWKTARGKAVKGQEFGCMQGTGYLQGQILGKRQYAHRLVWLLNNKTFPIGTIDHINGDKTDNRIENLRDVSQAINNQNLKKARSHSKSGLLGVITDGKRFRACIRTNGKTEYLGSFDTAEKAHMVYMSAKKIKHNEAAV